MVISIVRLLREPFIKDLLSMKEQRVETVVGTDMITGTGMITETGMIIETGMITEKDTTTGTNTTTKAKDISID